VTRIISESTPLRTQKDLSWRDDQLERRPAPRSASTHAFDFRQTTSAAADQNTYWSGFSMNIPKIWFDEILVDTDGFFGGGNDAPGGSLAQVPSGLGGFYVVTAHLAITATTPLVTGAYWNLDTNDAGQAAQMTLDPDMVGSATDEWFFTQTSVFNLVDFQYFSVSAHLSPLTAPALEDSAGIYTRMMGVRLGDAVPFVP
jgi:hypothetical protein